MINEPSKNQVLRIGAVLFVAIVFLSIFAPHSAQAEDVVLLDGFHVDLLGEKGQVSDLTYYNLKYQTPDAELVPLFDTMMKLGNKVLTPQGSTYFGYYKGEKNNQGNPVLEQTLTHYNVDNGDQVEVSLFYRRDGLLDLEQSTIGRVPVEYKGGRPTEDGVTDIICYYTGITPMTKTGLCEYSAFSAVQILTNVKDGDIQLVRDHFAKLQKKENPTTQTNDGLEHVDDRFIVKGAHPPLPTSENVAIPDEWKPKQKDSGAASENSSDKVGGVVAPSSEPAEGDSNAATTFDKNTFFSTLKPKKLPLFSSLRPNLQFQATTTILSEGFESGFPSGWSHYDNQTNNGNDYWDVNASTAHTGSKSIWSAQSGTQQVNLFSTGFEGSNPLSNWVYYDSSTAAPYGADYWGLVNGSTYAYSGSKAAFCATYYNGSTSNTANYDNGMNAFLIYNQVYNASNWASGEITYHVKYNTESGVDYVYLVVYNPANSSWVVLQGDTGNSSGYQTRVVTIPSYLLTSQMSFGFYFLSDNTITNVGAYVDDVSLNAYVNNAAVGHYDDYMDARLETPAISLSSIYAEQLKYWVKSDVESFWDYYTVEASASSSFTSPTMLLTDSNTISSWTQKIINIDTLPYSPVYLRFNFHSDGSNHSYNGTFIDDISVVGNNLLPNGSACTNPNQCTSNICSGSSPNYYTHCPSDGSSQVIYDQWIYPPLCGGNSSNYTSTPNWLTQTCSSGNVCDQDLAQAWSTYNTANICRTGLYGVCSTNANCWNDNGGVDCMGSASISKVCTYGNNGDSCNVGGTGDDDLKCDSGRCDSTCQAKLPNGSACNEPSDCIANACTNGFCGNGAGAGASCNVDTDCASGYCIADTPSQNHCSATYSPVVYNDDTWDSNASNGQSSAIDQTAFTTYSVRPVTYDLRQSTDMICYDLQNDGTYDVCYYDTNGGCGGASCGANSCNAFSIPNSVPSNKKFGCDIDSYAGCQLGVNGIADQICNGSSCVVDTNTPKSAEVRVKAYASCGTGNSSELQLPDTAEDNYYIINTKYDYCSNQSSPGTSYVYAGDWGANSGSITYFNTGTCPANQSCSIAADKQLVTTASGTIPSPCKKNVGQSCTQNSECLYNSCQSNICQSGMIISGQHLDVNGSALSNIQVKLTTCSDALIASTTANAKGFYSFTGVSGNYKLKLVMPWGESTVNFGTSTSPSFCHAYSAGFNPISTTSITSAVVTGTALNPQGNPSVNLPFALTTCQDQSLTSTNTNSQGQFSLSSAAGYQKLKVQIGNNWVPVSQTQTGQTCNLNYGNVNYGLLEFTDNCSLYENTCNASNNRLYSCHSDPATGCSCSVQVCANGCTEGAPQCNAVGTGTLKITVKKGSNPIPNAPLLVNDQNVGKSNGWGKKDVAREYNAYTVKATCPNSPSINAQQTVVLNSSARFINFDLNCPVSQKGDLKVIAHDNQNFPVANVYVFLDDDTAIRGITDTLGVAMIKGLDYGSHNLVLAYKQDANATPVQLAYNVDVNAVDNNVSSTILFSGQVGYSQSTIFIGGHISSVAVVTKFLVVDPAVGLAQVVDRYCSCVYPATAQAPKLAQCISSFACVAGPGNSLLFASNQCQDWYAAHLDAGGICTQLAFPAVGAVALTVGGDEILSIAAKPLGFLGETAVMKEFGSVVGETLGQIATKLGEFNLLQRSEGIGIKFSLSERGYIAPFVNNRIKTAIIELGLDNAQLTDEGAQAAYNFVKGIESYYGHPPAVAQNLAKNITIFGPENPTELFNAIGKLQTAGKNTGLIVNGEVVTITNGSKLARIVQNMSAIEETGKIANIKGVTKEIVSAANVYFDEFVEFPANEIGDLRLTGNRRVEVKNYGISQYTDPVTFTDISNVAKPIRQMEEILTQIPNPQNGKHLIQFNDFLNTANINQKQWILQKIADDMGMTLNDVIARVDVVAYG